MQSRAEILRQLICFGLMGCGADGNLDLVTLLYQLHYADRNKVFLNNGSGHFAHVGNLPVSSAYGDCTGAFGDVDGGAPNVRSNSSPEDHRPAAAHKPGRVQMVTSTCLLVRITQLPRPGSSSMMARAISSLTQPSTSEVRRHRSPTI